MTPTMLVQVWRKDGNDVYGQPALTRAPDELVAPVKLIFTSAHTTVRTDSSASHGAAEEQTANVVVLARPTTRIRMDDQLVVNGNKVRVITLHERRTVAGRVDHIEIHCTAWE